MCFSSCNHMPMPFFRAFNHPNVLALLGVLIDTESVTLITNLVNGKDLHHIIKSSKVSLFHFYESDYICADEIFSEDRLN